MGMQDIDTIEELTHLTLAKLEQCIPRSDLAVMFHLAGHLPAQLRQFGPLRATWMFPLEGHLGFLKSAVKNRAQVGLCGTTH